MRPVKEKPLVAIVGRPNVGKSTLFNRLAEERIAIVDEVPGVTRDVLSAECFWDGYFFTILDTGGLGRESEDPLKEIVGEEALKAVIRADLVILVADVNCGVTEGDLELRNILYKAGKQVVLAVNKVDHASHEALAQDFHSLGIERTAFVSALGGRNVDVLCDLVVNAIRWEKYPRAKVDRRKGHEHPRESSEAKDELPPTIIKVAIFGKRNVGKSSLLNAVIRDKRSLVSDIPGTTRDTVSAELLVERFRFIFTDTAGLLKLSKMDDVEYYSYARASKALGDADVCVLVLDTERGVEEMDKRVAKNIEKRVKGVVIACNKWDLFEDSDLTRSMMKEHIYSELERLTFAPVVFVSAKEGTGLEELIESIVLANENYKRLVNKKTLLSVIEEETTMNPPPVVKGRALKIYSAEQYSTSPPRFVFLINEKRLLRKSYRNFLENVIRRHFEFQGTHILLNFRERKRKSKVGGIGRRRK